MTASFQTINLTCHNMSTCFEFFLISNRMSHYASSSSNKIKMSLDTFLFLVGLLHFAVLYIFFVTTLPNSSFAANCCTLPYFLFLANAMHGNESVKQALRLQINNNPINNNIYCCYIWSIKQSIQVLTFSHSRLQFTMILLLLTFTFTRL